MTDNPFGISIRFSNRQLARSAIFAMCLMCVAPTAQAARLPIVAPHEIGMDAKHLNHIDAIVAQGIQKKQLPGCVVAVGRNGKIGFLRAYGHQQLEPKKVEMTTDTVFDMASITKPVATATSIMILWEQGKLRLRDKFSKHIPEFAVNGKQDITIQQLLTHQAGLIPDNALKDYDDGPQKAFERIHGLKTYVPPGSKFVYTDVGFILLAELVERLSGKNVHEFSQEHLFAPLGMTETGYLPSDTLKSRCAVTEQREGRWMQGEVHDPRAYRLNGIAGHAGLFSTAQDLAVYATMMIDRGRFNQKQILNARTIDVMTKAYPVSSGTRGLGWDKLTGYSSNRGENLSEKAFGHGGFTGTVLWIDPDLDLFYILLSNRVHPNGKGSVNHLAGRIGTVAAAAIRDEKGALHDKAATNRKNANQQSMAKTDSSANRPVKTGLDVLAADNFKLLQGQRVGLITNQTGIDRTGRSNIRLMHDSERVNLVALFSPEHGLAGKLDIPKIADASDQETGLKIFSLYGETRKPSAKQLAQIDCLVFDIQDIGTRFYTYISTMGLAMQAAAETQKEFIVLDRPNPIGGTVVGGPVLDSDKTSFIGFHTIPIRHGMTIGELAKLFNDELGLQLDLHIVEVADWQRGDLFDQTHLQWVNPSPNMRNLNQALLYPGVGLLETTNLSVGRGTDTPFEIIGAPWLEGGRFAAALNGLDLTGVRFVPVRFTPNSSVFADESCSGVQILITDRARLRSLETGLALATTLHRLFADKWQVDRYARLLGNDETMSLLKKGEMRQDITEAWQPRLHSFMQRRLRYLIY